MNGIFPWRSPSENFWPSMYRLMVHNNGDPVVYSLVKFLAALVSS